MKFSGNIPSYRYARLAVQMENQTNAQANVQIDVEFGRKGIRDALQRSLDNAEVIYLSNNKAFIEKGIVCNYEVE